MAIAYVSKKNKHGNLKVVMFGIKTIRVIRPNQAGKNSTCGFQ